MKHYKESYSPLTGWGLVPKPGQQLGQMRSSLVCKTSRRVPSQQSHPNHLFAANISIDSLANQIADAVDFI